MKEILKKKDLPKVSHYDTPMSDEMKQQLKILKEERKDLDINEMSRQFFGKLIRKFKAS